MAIKDNLEKKNSTELRDLVTSEEGLYTQETKTIAFEILHSRGEETNLSYLFEEKLKTYSDDALVDVIETRSENYSEEVRSYFLKELEKRGFEIEHKEEVVTTESKINYEPLVIAIILFVLRFMFLPSFKEIFRGDYEELLLWILAATFVEFSLVYYYRSLQSKKFIVLWCVAGLLFGSWALLVVGLVELFRTN